MSQNRLRILWRAMMLATLSCLIVIASALAISNPPKEPEHPAKAKAPAAKGKAAPAKKNLTLAEVVTELHVAKTLLDSAAHDYDGHRAKAIEHVHHAIKELTPFLGEKEKKLVATNAKTAEVESVPAENQIQSDTHLKSSHEILTGLHLHLNQKQHEEAVSHIIKSVEELNVALKIK